MASQFALSDRWFSPVSKQEHSQPHRHLHRRHHAGPDAGPGRGRPSRRNSRSTTSSRNSTQRRCRGRSTTPSPTASAIRKTANRSGVNAHAGHDLLGPDVLLSSTLNGAQALRRQPASHRLSSEIRQIPSASIRTHIASADQIRRMDILPISRTARCPASPLSNPVPASMTSIRDTSNRSWRGSSRWRRSSTR